MRPWNGWNWRGGYGFKRLNSYNDFPTHRNHPKNDHRRSAMEPAYGTPGTPHSEAGVVKHHGLAWGCQKRRRSTTSWPWPFFLRECNEMHGNEMKLGSFFLQKTENLAHHWHQFSSFWRHIQSCQRVLLRPCTTRQVLGNLEIEISGILERNVQEILSMGLHRR